MKSRSRRAASWFLAIALFLLPAAAGGGGDKIALTVEPADLARFVVSGKPYGALEWRGGLSLASQDERFGGFSGVVVTEGGARLTAVSDRAYWLDARLAYKDGELIGVTDARMASMLAENGKPFTGKHVGDSEALALDGRQLIVGFEGKTRIERYDVLRKGFDARPQRQPIPKEIDAGPRNGELEAIGRFAAGPNAGRTIAIAERNFDAMGNVRAWIWRGNSVSTFPIARHSDYSVTDLAILPGGDVVTIERAFSANSLPGMAIRRIAGADLPTKPGAAAEPVEARLLFEGRQPFYAVDNMEGIAVHKAEDGEIRLTVISDDNYNRGLQRTLLFQFALGEE